MAKVKVIQVLSDRRAVFCRYIFHSSSIAINLGVTSCSLLAGGVFHCPSVFSCLIAMLPSFLPLQPTSVTMVTTSNILYQNQETFAIVKLIWTQRPIGLRSVWILMNCNIYPWGFSCISFQRAPLSTMPHTIVSSTSVLTLINTNCTIMDLLHVLHIQYIMYINNTMIKRKKVLLSVAQCKLQVFSIFSFWQDKHK